jgi:hypothetical protein
MGRVRVPVVPQTDAVVNRFSLDKYVVDTDLGDGPVSQELAVPVIDGTPLFELVGSEWPGRFPGIATSLLARGSGQWRGSPRYSEAGRDVLLDGECGEAGCCGVFALVSIDGDAVRWSDFRARGRPDLPPDLAFEFVRTQYLEAIRALPAIEPKRWSSPHSA